MRCVVNRSNKPNPTEADWVPKDMIFISDSGFQKGDGYGETLGLTWCDLLNGRLSYITAERATSRYCCQKSYSENSIDRIRQLAASFSYDGIVIPDMVHSFVEICSIVTGIPFACMYDRSDFAINNCHNEYRFEVYNWNKYGINDSVDSFARYWGIGSLWDVTIDDNTEPNSIVFLLPEEVYISPVMKTNITSDMFELHFNTEPHNIRNTIVEKIGCKYEEIEVL